VTTHRRRFQWGLWGAPIALAVISAIGLIAGLLGDGIWDAASWLALGLPVGVCTIYGLRRRKPD